MADDFKYHIDHHVGLIPPPELAEARARGDEAGLREAEDTAIREAIRMQRRVGVTAIGDGNYRRRNALSVIHDGIEGFGGPEEGALRKLLGADLVPEQRALVGKPVAKGRLTGHETGFLVAAIQRPTVVSLPAPGFVAALAGSADAELAAIAGTEIAAIAADGVRYVQLHNPLYAFLLTVEGRARAAALDIDADATVARMLETDDAAVSGLDVPPEFRVGLDITTTAAVSLDYDEGALTDFLARQPFGRLCVEHPAASPFPIERVPAGLVVSLGVVDASDAEPEPVDDLLDRVDKAAAVIDIDDIALSTNGAFRAPVSAAEQRSKLQAVETVARYYWGNEL